MKITPLILPQLPITRQGLTEFTYSRFLCPYLSGFKGITIFMDADMLVLCDIYQLVEQHSAFNAVSVAQHQQRFEWPSLMVFTNGSCQKLTPEFVDNGANKLFDFAWASNIGNLPSEYNHCIGYDAPRDDAKIVHFTQGIPCFQETADSEYQQEWMDELASCTSTVPWFEIMGGSVHAEPVLERYRAKQEASHEPS